MLPIKFDHHESWDHTPSIVYDVERRKEEEEKEGKNERREK